MYWCLQYITNQINDGDFWGKAIGILQKPTEHFPYSSSHQILTNYGLQEQFLCSLKSSTPLHIRMDRIILESDLKVIRIHNAQHHKNIP